jgi:VanZ family protein
MDKTQTTLTARVWRWGPALAVMAAIFIASSFPSRDLPDFGLWDRLVKKGGHAAGYALLAAAYLHGLARGRRPTARQALLAVLLAGLYGITDELHQSLVPGRRPSPVDIGIDTLGACLGAGVWWSVRK